MGRARFARSARRLVQEGEPATNVRLAQLTDLEHLALDEQILLKLAQRRLVPGNGFGLVPGSVVMLQISLNGLLNGRALLANRYASVLLRLQRSGRNLGSLGCLIQHSLSC